MVVVMNELQQALIEGSLLGDGCFTRLKKHPTWNWKFSKKQSKLDNMGTDKFSYVKYHEQCLSSFTHGSIYNYKQKPSTIAKNKTATPVTAGYQYITRTNPVFTELGKMWYSEQYDKLIKHVPRTISLHPLSLCIWYMDDGSKEPGINRCRIATNGFCENDVLFLIHCLKSKHGIESIMHMQNKQPMIEINGYTNYKKLYDTIISYVSWACFTYKIELPKPVVVLRGEDNHKAKLNQHNITTILDRYRKGETQKDISRDFAVKKNTISTIICGKSWNNCGIDLFNIPLGGKGERNPKAKLTKEQVIKIRQLYPQKSYGQIATMYSVSRSTIFNIVKGNTWN